MRLTAVFVPMALAGMLLPLVLIGLFAPADPAPTPPATADVPPPDRPKTHVTDARGTPVPVRHYRRIVSCSTIADALLPDLVARDRVVACTTRYAENGARAFRVAGLIRIHNTRDTERILATDPDLVILSSFTAGETAHVARLRERGIPVFDLGDMLGLRTLTTNIRDLAAILGVPERGTRLAAALTRRMARVAAFVPPEKRRHGLYLNAHDTQLTGGTVGSSYHDVLNAAGLIDCAATFVAGRDDPSAPWPRYRVEDLLRLDPEVIVTTTGKAAALRAVPGLENLRAWHTPGGVIEMPPTLMEAAGPDMLLAAEMLHAQLYPEAVGRADPEATP